MKRKRTVEANVATWDIVKEEEAEDIRARNFDFNPRAMIHEFDPRVMDLNMIQAMQSMSGNFGW